MFTALHWRECLHFKKRNKKINSRTWITFCFVTICPLTAGRKQLTPADPQEKPTQIHVGGERQTKEQQTSPPPPPPRNK